MFNLLSQIFMQNMFEGFKQLWVKEFTHLEEKRIKLADPGCLHEVAIQFSS